MAATFPVLSEAEFTPWMRSLAEHRSRKRIPAFAAPGSLPPLHDGARALPTELVGSLLKLLAEQTEAAPDPLIAAARGWASAESLGDFSRALYEAWRDRGKFSKTHEWVIAAVGHLGGAVGLSETIAELGASGKKSERDRARRLLAAPRAQADDAALRALLLLTWRGDTKILVDLDAAISAAAARRGTSRDALEEALLPLEETLRALDRPKSIPSLVKLKALPPLRYRDGRPLDKGLTGGIIRAMVHKGQGPNLVWRSVQGRLRALLDPASAEDFVNAMLAAWEQKRFHGSSDWIQDGLRSFGGDRTALALKPTLARWSSRRATDTERQKAISAMDIFQRIGTETALLVLVGLGARNTRPSVYDRANQVIASAAKRRGLSRGQLEDRITPSCGLDAGGSRRFDYGPRKFTLAFDEDFRPRIKDPVGGYLDALPPPAPGDDLEGVAQAQAEWALIAGQLAEILEVQTERLQQSMIAGRRWIPAEWRRYLLEHPLMVNYTRRLIWGSYDAGGALVTSFRAAEDGGLVDRNDEELPPVPDEQTIGLIHPATLSAEDRAGWGEYLADYEIITAFPQLERPVFAPSAEELSRKKLTRFADASVPARRLYDVLIGLQWDRDGFGPMRTEFFKNFTGAGLRAEIRMDPGYYAGGVDHAEPQRLPDVTFYGTRSSPGSTNRPLRLGEVDPVIFSEVLRDLYEVIEG